jgi:(p)ppGpp synthase/HD superfamily hydrolase
MLEKAISIAANAHSDQKDKAGKPYILHPIRVMLKLNSEEEMIIGVLHDVIEDTNITSDDLLLSGFSINIVNTLICLSRDKKQSYDSYIDNICTNKLACKVKLADLEDNMNINRIPNPTEKDYQRNERYHAAYLKIIKALD